MSNKMLIDASHPEETRVIVTRGNKIEEFDFESEHKKQLKGNIYLARVTRVEPSLQAAFVEYGGNRHGFLAFSEIHPDYYQIPVADRLALLEAEAKAARAADDEEDEPKAKNNDRSRRHRRRGRRDGQNANVAKNGVPAAEPVGPAFADYIAGTPAIALMKLAGDVVSEGIESSDNDDDDDENDVENEEDIVESVGSEDAMEELPSHGRTNRRQYNIQEVIKRRQIILVQVVKEERGNKGAALTTYLSLAGRYSVLMPNTARGGGISRKITNPQDRKRLKEIVKELEVPQGMGVILRTAGANRTKADIKRDYEYLMRMWENVRTLTLQSTAPSLVYEEGSLIKRSIRDLYNKEITEILVAGETGYREAKDFMRMLMPTHAKVVQPYREQVPVFTRYGLEAQLDRMLLPQVTLKSGGYLIINQTEALVAIDVNSGRSTREHSIEDTALQTNLEAAEEVARQLRLRDLAGLIVVDFIDMEEKRNNRAVEKKMKDCLKDDRARIQVGRISHFGLLEMSRQRIRASVLESTMQVCQHCGGTGHVRSDSSMALHIIRGIEDYLLRHSGYDITVRTPVASALYVLNHKRELLADLEGRFGASISIDADDSVGHQHFVIDKGAPSTRPITIHPAAPIVYEDDLNDPDIPLDEDEAEEEVRDEVSTREENSEDGDRKRRKRRRRRGGRDREGGEQAAQTDSASESSDEDDEEDANPHGKSALSEEDRRKKRRRGRRGGRKNRREDDIHARKVPAPEFVGYTPVIPAPAEESPAEVSSEITVSEAVAVEIAAVEAPVATEPVVVEEDQKPAKPARKPRGRKAAKTEEAASEDVVVADPAEEPAKPARKPRGRKKVVEDEAAAEAAAPAEEAEVAKPKRRTRKVAAKAEAENLAAESELAPAAEPQKAAEPEKVAEPVVTSSETEEQKPKRGGWWQKKGFF